MKLSQDQRDTLRLFKHEKRVKLANRSPTGCSLVRKGLCVKHLLVETNDRGDRMCELVLTEDGRAVVDALKEKRVDP